MSDVIIKDRHVLVFLNAAGQKMQTSWVVKDPADPVEALSIGYAIGRAEQKIRAGSYGSMTGLTFVRHELQDAVWREARDKCLAEAAA